MKIFCLGSAVLDIAASGVPFPENWQEKQRIAGIFLRPGGDAVNQAIRLSRLGHEAFLLSAVGVDKNGSFLNSELKRQGVRTNHLTEKPGRNTGMSLVLVHPDGERRAFSAGGAYGSLTFSDLPDPEGADAISVASLFQMPELEANGLSDWLTRAGKSRIPVFADLGSDKYGLGLDGIRHFLPLIDYFLPSRADALAMTAADTVEEAADIFLSCGCPCVCIKCGAEGAYLISAGSPGLHIPAPAVTPIDTTGAGDCMAAVFLSRILAGDSSEESCRKACISATESTLHPGAN